MNKYFLLLGIIILILLGGVFYRVFLLPEGSVPLVTGEVREVTITARKDRWFFDPEIIEVNHGDRVIVTVVNEDNYDHGIAIDAFGVSQRMPAKGTIKFEFVATQAGQFPLYCSVPCGEGMVDGKKRGHFDMVGRIHVRSIISATE